MEQLVQDGLEDCPIVRDRRATVPLALEGKADGRAVDGRTNDVFVGSRCSIRMQSS